jgi:hypothetical protein
MFCLRRTFIGFLLCRISLFVSRKLLPTEVAFVEVNNQSRTLNAEPEQALKDVQLLMLRSVCRHSRKLLLCAVVRFTAI